MKPATTEIYTYCNTLSLPDALPISCFRKPAYSCAVPSAVLSAILPVNPSVTTTSTAPAGMSLPSMKPWNRIGRSEEHTSELQSLMRISYAVFCLKKNIHKKKQNTQQFYRPNRSKRHLVTHKV